MKIRTDFVTNSSSSSFIISTRKQLPEEYKSHFHEITQGNLKQIFEYYFSDFYVSYEISNEEFQELGYFTDEQMLLILFATNGELDTYKKIKEALEESKKTGASVYISLVDRDWLYYHPDFKTFIDSTEIIEEDFER